MAPILQLALLVAILLPAGKIGASLCSRFGIPAILAELMIGIVLGPGALNILHLRMFEGGQATGALMLLAQLGGYVLMFIAGIETDVDRMREASMTACYCGAVRSCLAISAGSRRGAHAGPFLDDRMLLGRSANGDERFYFRANIDGRGEDDFTRSDGDFGCGQ